MSSNAKVSTRDVNGKTVLHLAAACGHLPCLRMILQYMSAEEATALDHQQCSALHWAAYNGHSDCVEYLLQRKIFAGLEGNAFSPVHCATFVGSEKCLELLVTEFGEGIVNLKDGRRRTPLHVASLHGHVECVRLLLEKGADVEAKDEEGRTAFVAAAQYGQTQVVGTETRNTTLTPWGGHVILLLIPFVSELLLTTTTTRVECDNHGNTALHLACLRKHSQTGLVILEDPNSQQAINMLNKENKT